MDRARPRHNHPKGPGGGVFLHTANVLRRSVGTSGNDIGGGDVARSVGNTAMEERVVWSGGGLAALASGIRLPVFHPPSVRRHGSVLHRSSACGVVAGATAGAPAGTGRPAGAGIAQG